VGTVRRITPRGTLPRRLVTRAEARVARDEAVAAMTSGPEIAGRTRLWERLGLLRAGADYARLLAAQLDAPAATYDPGARRLSVPDWIPLGDQRLALAHALAHALADQRFGLRDTLEIGLDGRHRLEGDAERARLALIEGDASVTTLEVADPRGGLTSLPEVRALAARLREPGPGAAKAPAWIRANGAFVMADGLMFVARVRARQPWSAVDALWASPPQSSEQVLHPEKYDARERPVAVVLDKPKALGDGWREAATDVLGELGVRTWLSAAVSDELAARAAAGWGGDRAALFEAEAPPAPPDAGVFATDGGAPAPPPRRSFVVWSTVWDDVTDAEDFARAAANVLALRAGDKSAAAPDDPHSVIARGDAGVYALAWRGNAVALLLGAPETALAILDELPPKESTRSPPRARPSPRKRGEGEKR
jgi:hypothetical protein